MIKKLVDIGTKKLELSIHGDGLPIVVIETGMGCPWYDWFSIINEISEKTTVLAYHRAGYGQSTIGEDERTTRNIAEDLNVLLEKEDINSPIILVGHSFGGLCVQHFACSYPEKVLGIVLVDSNSIDEYKLEEIRQELPSFKTMFSKNKIIENWKDLSLKKDLQLGTLISPKLLSEQMAFTEEIQKCILQFQVNPNMYSAMASELTLMVQSGQEIKNCYKTLDVPLKVLCRDKDVAIDWNIKMGIPENESIVFEGLWHDLVREEADNSTKGQFVEVKGSKHSIYRSNPESVIKAIIDVIEEVG